MPMTEVHVDSPELQDLVRNPRPIQVRIVLSVASALVILNCIYAYDTIIAAIKDAKKLETTDYLHKLKAIGTYAENAYSAEFREFDNADAGRVSAALFEHVRQDIYLNMTVPSYLTLRLGDETHSVSAGLLDREISLVISSIEQNAIENVLEDSSLQGLTNKLERFTYTEIEADDYLIGQMVFAEGTGSIVFAQKSNAKTLGVRRSATRTISFLLVVVWLGVWFSIVIAMVVGRRLRESNDSIRKAIVAKERLNADLEILVAGRTTELSEANAELTTAARSKDEFLASMSHELRTPLNAILNMSECLEEGIFGPLTEEQRSATDTVTSSGRHLLSLINDILDLAKASSGAMKLSVETVIVEDLCHASVRLIKASADKKRLTVETSFDESARTIRADPRRLKQALINLLGNAVKFTPEGGTIGLQVKGSHDKEALHFSVWDTGIGISHEDQSRLFKRFVQLDSGLNRQYEGTGLGLSLVLAMTDLHGGGVHVESRGPGFGSRFTISLPLSETMLEEGSQAAMDPQMGIPPAPGMGSKDIAGTDSDVQAGPLILLAEDNTDNITAVSTFLKAKGYRLVVARDGAKAVDLARQEHPALILMDIQMPKLDGREAMRELRKDPGFAGVPMIALTALAMAGDRERCLAAGADEYMTKPVSLKKLNQAIEQLLSAADSRQAQ